MAVAEVKCSRWLRKCRTTEKGPVEAARRGWTAALHMAAGGLLAFHVNQCRIGSGTAVKLLPMLREWESVYDLGLFGWPPLVWRRLVQWERSGLGASRS